MQLLEHWDPLNLPRGSIRALITLSLLGVLFALLVLDRPVSIVYAALVLSILGHYFGSRKAEAKAEDEAPRTPPLGLPNGSIRTIILLSFAGVGYWLWDQGRLEWGDPTDTTLVFFLLGGAMIVGFFIRSLLNLLGRRNWGSGHRLVQNAKSIVTILATGLLAVSTCLGNEEVANQNIALICAPIVGYYFGSRD